MGLLLFLHLFLHWEIVQFADINAIAPQYISILIESHELQVFAKVIEKSKSFLVSIHFICISQTLLRHLITIRRVEYSFCFKNTVIPNR